MSFKFDTPLLMLSCILIIIVLMLLYIRNCLFLNSKALINEQGKWKCECQGKHRITKLTENKKQICSWYIVSEVPFTYFLPKT